MFDTNWHFSKQLAGEKQEHYQREAAAERFAKLFRTQEIGSSSGLTRWLSRLGAKIGQRLQRRDEVELNLSYQRVITNNPMEDCMTC
jgi:hypothetical protein